MALGDAPAMRPLDIAILSLAMGMLNVAMSRLGAEPVSLTFVTGTLARVGTPPGAGAAAGAARSARRRLG